MPEANSSDAPSPSEISTGQERRFEMKPLGDAYQTGEKQAEAQTVMMNGQETSVREKEWLRQETDKVRAEKGLKPATDEMWKAHVATTQYMDDTQRAEHQVGFESGVDGTGAANAKLTGGSVEEGGQHIFVMDGQGQVFAKEGQAALNQEDDTGRKVHVHHSSFLSGEDVAGAGEMNVSEDGFLKEVTDRSGHYKPGEVQTTQTLAELENKGVNLDNVKFTLDRGTEKVGGMAREFQQGGAETFKARHTLADELREKGGLVRATLDQDAERRAKRVEKATDYLEQGVDYQDVSQGAAAHAAKDEKTLGPKMEGAVGEQLKDAKKALTVREALKGNLDYGHSNPGNAKGLRV